MTKPESTQNASHTNPRLNVTRCWANGWKLWMASIGGKSLSSILPLYPGSQMILLKRVDGAAGLTSWSIRRWTLCGTYGESLLAEKSGGRGSWLTVLENHDTHHPFIVLLFLWSHCSWFQSYRPKPRIAHSALQGRISALGMPSHNFCFSGI